MQRYFEEVEVGDELPRLEKGPLTIVHLMRWSAAMENWHRIHYDKAFAIEHDKLPGLLINGTLKQQFVTELLRKWAGHGGWVWKVGFQFRAMNLVGETLSMWARVIAKRGEQPFGLIDLELGIVNVAKKESTPGSAVIALPYENGPPVPYPFVPPAQTAVTGDS